jgi:hypothetical protein
VHPIVTTLTTVAAVANGYALAQSAVGRTGLTLNGSLVTNGVGNPGTPRRVAITSSGNDSGINFTITGTARAELNGVALTETIAGTNAGVAVSTQDFATVTGIVASANSAGTVTAGTAALASGPWVPWDQFPPDFQVSLAGYVLSGTPTWQVDYTYDDVFGTWLPPSVPFARPLVHSVLNGRTGAGEGFFTSPIRASRLTISAGAGSVQLTQIQQGP